MNGFLMAFTVTLLILGVLLGGTFGIRHLIVRYARSYRNNANKGIVYTNMGNDFAPPAKARRVAFAGEGQIYLYVQEGKELAVMVPADYGYQFINGRRVIGVKDGLVYANPLGNDKVKLPLESSEDISNLVKGKVFNDLVYSLKGATLPLILIIVILAMVGFGAYYFLNRSNEASPAPPTITNSQQAIPPPTQTAPIINPIPKPGS